MSDTLDDDDDDDFDYRPVRSGDKAKKSGSAKGIKIAVAIVAISGIAAGSWYYLGQTATSSDRIPLVRAEAQIFKSQPENPGGMEVPNRDKEIYQRIDGEPTEPRVERLLPSSEQPMDKPQLLNSATVETPASPTLHAPLNRVTEPLRKDGSPLKLQPRKEEIEQARSATTEATDMVKSAEPSTPVAPSPAPVEGKVQSMDSVVKEVLDAEKQTTAKIHESAAKPAPAPSVAPQVASTTESVKLKPVEPKLADNEPVYTVQLLSLRDGKQAETEWSRLSKKYASLLGSLSHDVEKADLGAKGVYYRLRAGSYPAREGADQLCSKLKAEKVGCLVVRAK